MSRVAITLILAPNFGERLAEIPADQVIWIVHSEANEEARRKLDTARRAAVTIFTAESADEEATLEAAMDMIEDHHDEYSEEGPWRDLAMVGVTLTRRVRELLEDYGASSVEQEGEEIHATRSASRLDPASRPDPG